VKAFFAVDFLVWRPHQNYHSAVEQSHRDVAWLGTLERVSSNVKRGPANTFGASRKSKLRSRTVHSRFAGSNVILMSERLCSYGKARVKFP